MTLANATVLFHAIEQKLGLQGSEILAQVGRRQTLAFSYILFSKKKPNHEQLKILLQYLDIFGLGKIRIVSISHASKEATFEIKNCAVCLMKKKLFSQNATASNAFVEGVCRGIAELLFDEPMQAKKTQCVTRNKDSCFVKTSKILEKSQDPILDGFTEKSFSVADKRRLDNTQADLIKKVSGHYMIDWNEGMFTLWGCSLFMMPSLSFVYLIKTLEERSLDWTHTLLYHLARVQSRESVLFQLQKMGFKKDITLLKSILEHSDITGFGSVKLVHADFEKKMLSVEQYFNPYSYYTNQLFGKSSAAADYYVCGLLAGASQGFFGVEMEDVEEKCIAKGDECCSHKSQKKGKTSRYPIDSQLLKLIEEKITVQNFIL